MIKHFKSLSIEAQKKILIDKVESMTADNAEDTEATVKWHLREHKEKLWAEEED